MKAHLVQMDIAWEDRDTNHRTVERMLDQADVGKGDLVVLPELFDVGFSLNLDAAPDAGGRTLRFLLGLADDLDVTIQGGRAVRPCDCDKAFNRATVTAPALDSGDEGRLLCEYAKIHPFSFGREPESYRGGDSIETYDWASGQDSMTVCPAVCYDLRFPELFRLGAMRGAECFAIGANWPGARRGHWRALLIARAIENQAYVLGVNRSGDDPHLSYAGGSIAVSPTGEVIGELDANPGVLTIDVDPVIVREWRSQFPALDDIRLLRRESRLGGDLSE
ncbi:MAG: nitrilase-related carbon-nitrogen hydrolase [Planctomycetota bacterium]